ncbi:MAG: hypothetical protein WCO07_01195 [bacterium]
MKEYKNISEVFKNWGREKQKFPEDNLILKDKILSKVPFSLGSYRNIEKKKKRLPWLSMAFATMATMAIVVVIGNASFFSKKTNYQGILGLGDQNTSGASITLEQNKMLDIFYYPNQNGGTDTREFLKISYNAEIKTRNVNHVVTKIETIVRGSSGRVDASSGGEKHGYVSFSIPKINFEVFRSQIEDLTNAKLFVEETRSANLLPEKQQIEKEQVGVEKTIVGLKNQKAQLARNHTEIIDSYNFRIYELNRESGLLQNEWQTAIEARRVEITARLAQILTEKNNLATKISSENNTYENKLALINGSLKSAGVSLENVQNRNQNLIDNVSMINGTISVTWVNLFQLVNIFISWYWIALVLAIASAVSYWRYRVSMRVFI